MPDVTSLSPALPHRRTRTWLLLTLLLFLLEVLPWLSHRWVTDESWYAGPGVTLSQEHGLTDPGMGPNDLEHTVDVRPPGTAVVMAGFFHVLGTTEVAARMGSVLAGVALPVLLFLLVRDVFGDVPALLCALLAATDNFLVTTARTARPEALTAFCIVLAMLPLKRYWRTAQLGWALLAGMVMALGTMFHITLLGFIVAYGVLLLVLDYRAGRMPVRGVLLYTVGYLAGLLPYAAWVLRMPGGLGRRSFQFEFLHRTAGAGLPARLLQELPRYRDYFGFGMLHGHGLAALPVRLPIPLVLLVATYLLWRYRRNWFYVELLLLLPSMLWLVYTVNKSSRYLAILAPVTALVLAGAVAAVWQRARLRRWAVMVVLLVCCAQFGANLLLLNGARRANYRQVIAQLSSVIPPGATAYGTVTFWFGLRDHPYVSSERTDPLQAARDYGARYFIAGDRMMTEGSATDAAYYVLLRQQFAQVEAMSTLVGEIDDPYYGDLKVYRLQ